VVGVTHSTKKVIAAEFPELEYIEVPSYNIRYRSARPVWAQLLPKAGNFFRVIKSEHQWLKEWVKVNKPDLIISDNRYGMYMPGITSWIICHQLQIKTPVLRGIANRIHRRLLKHFDLILVPDLPDVNQRLAGDLSVNRYGFNCRYISPLSRLKKLNKPIKYEFLFLLSGAEPSQSEWLQKIMEGLAKKAEKRFVVCSTSFYTGTHFKHIDFFNNPTSLELSELLASSNTIVLRSGYSSLMDIYVTGKTNLILVPSLGQTEQEYLANYWQVNFGVKVIEEDDLMNNF
jgi:hypothetical protein